MLFFLYISLKYILCGGSHKLSIDNIYTMFKDIQKRIFYFLVLCIGARLGLAYLAKNLTGKWSMLLSGVIASMGLGFLIVYFGGLRKTGAETGGTKIWWDHLRPVHGILYIIAAALLSYGHRCWGSQVILIDTLFGLTAFLLHHLREKNIRFF